MTTWSWIGVGVASWLVVSLATALGIGRLIRNGERQRTAVELAEALEAKARLETAHAFELSRRTLGGTPPGYHSPTEWQNRNLPGGVHDDYRHLRGGR